MNALLNIILEDSYVIDIKEPAPAEILCEFALSKEHPLYTTPQFGEAHCYRDGKFVFPEGEIKWIERRPSKTMDKSGSRDFGNIHSVSSKPDGISITGSFGEIKINSDKYTLLLFPLCS